MEITLIMDKLLHSEFEGKNMIISYNYLYSVTSHTYASQLEIMLSVLRQNCREVTVRKDGSL
jgi:hypothetical protein